MHGQRRTPAVWFPAIRTGTGTDVFTQRLCDNLNRRGIRAEIAWLPRRAEFLPWTVQAPNPPSWANVVHVNTWLHSRFIPAHLPVVATMHLCVHDPAFEPYKSRLQTLYHRHWIKPLEAIVLHRADRVVAVSHYTADRTREVFGTKDVLVIHNGVPIPADTNELPERQPHVPFRLLYVGNWSRRKGVDLLGRVMEVLGDRYELRYTADAYGTHLKVKLPVNCMCIGRVSGLQLQHAYKDADALLFPSRLEGFGLVAAEAMSNGLPVVAVNNSSLPEVIEDGVTGLLCPNDDIFEISRAIMNLAENADIWRNFSISSRSLVKHRFDINIKAGKYLSIYSEIVSSCN